MNLQYRDLLIVAVCVLLLGGYIAAGIDWENVLTPDSPTPVHLNGKIAQIMLPTQEQIVSIPQEVYDSMPYDRKMSRYLTGNQKYVLVVTFAGEPNPSVFAKQLTHLFQEKGYREYYRKYMLNLGNHWSASCRRHQTCSEVWINRTCAQKICLINPKTKQAVVSSGTNAKQLESLLQKYKEW